MSRVYNPVYRKQRYAKLKAQGLCTRCTAENDNLPLLICRRCSLQRKSRYTPKEMAELLETKQISVAPERPAPKVAVYEGQEWEVQPL